MLKSVSLASVRAFEAAARHGSFRAAAQEMNLSPSAVSHAILKLEQALGTALFEREGRNVHLSPDGEMLMRHVGTAFDELRRGMDAVSNRRARLLRLHSAPSFAAQWLSPRLKGFLAAQPDIEVRLAASADYARFINDDFDIDVVYGPPRAEGVIVVPLGEEVVTPLCSPELAPAIRTPDDLLGQVLIQSDVNRVQWPDWFEANGMRVPAPHGMRFDRSFLAIAAAVDGLGIALESTRLAERELQRGHLVAPLDGIAREVRYVGHFLVYPRAMRQRQPVRTFATWLLGQLGLDPSLPA
jgi:LysR family transcriptional regulator, glycine cleavage system transcriptional activator